MRAFEKRGADADDADAPEGLKVGKTSRVIVTLSDPLTVQLSDARELGGRNGEITVSASAVLQFQPDLEVTTSPPEGAPNTFIVRTRNGRLTVRGREIGEFSATPTDAGTQYAYLYLTDFRINEQEVDDNFSVYVGELSVAERSWLDRLKDLLFSTAGVAGALTTIIAFALLVFGLLYRRRKRDETPPEKATGPDTP